MNIKGRFVGDTNPLVMWIYDVDEDDKEIPVKLLTDICTVTFKYKLGDGATESINGTNMTDLGYVEFPFGANTVVEGNHVWTMRVANQASGEDMLYEKGNMNINSDI